MENNLQNYKVRFTASGADYFGVIIINWLLTIFSLGLYYPWAKEKRLKFLFGNTYLENSKFSFTGTGKEMFVGFIKVYALFAGLYLVIIYAQFIQNLQLTYILLIAFYLLIIAFIPFAIHGYFRYRSSRTSWRGIRFGYRGERKTFSKNFYRDLLLTFITFGIYGSWMIINIRNYTLSNLRFGNAEVKHNANGADYFLLNLKGIFLTYITLGIYSFWYQRDIMRFFANNISLHHNGKKIECKTIISAGDVFELLIINMLIIVFTFGLGFAFTEVRTYRKMAETLVLQGDLDLDNIIQTEQEYKNAMGDEALDMMDFSGLM